MLVILLISRYRGTRLRAGGRCQAALCRQPPHAPLGDGQHRPVLDPFDGNETTSAVEGYGEKEFAQNQ